jgi:ankyrin repeat protein
MQARADINKPDHDGFTPLHSAAERCQQSFDKSLIWLLLENGANINARTKLGLTVLYIVAERWQESSDKSLIWLLLGKERE